MFSRRAVIVLLAASLPGNVVASGENVDELRAEVEELKQALSDRDRLIEDLSRRLAAIEAALSSTVPVDADTAPDFVRTPQPPSEPVHVGVDALVAAAAEAEREEQERLIRAAFEQTLIDRGGLLLPAGSLEVESSFSYIGSSTDRIVIDGFTIMPVLIIGDIVNERIRTDIVQSTVTARYGLPYDWQLELRVPYGYQQRRTVTAENEQTTVTRTGLGDIELALSRQLLRGAGRRPDVLGSVRWKSTTGGDPFARQGEGQLSLGSGFDSLSTGLTVVRVIDPVVFFAGLSYTYNDPIRLDGARYKSGDTVGVQLGLAIALNLDTSVSFAFDQQYTSSSELDGRRLPGSSLVTGNFSVGASYAFATGRTVDVGLRVGVTADSPDLQVTLGVPLRVRR